MSLGDSAEKYELGLMYGPLIGFTLAIIGATSWSLPAEFSRGRRRGGIAAGLGPTSQTG